MKKVDFVQFIGFQSKVLAILQFRGLKNVSRFQALVFVTGPPFCFQDSATFISRFHTIVNRTPEATWLDDLWFPFIIRSLLSRVCLDLVLVELNVGFF